MRDVARWAEEQFGHAELGDLRRTRRLVEVGAEAARRPSGIISDVCTSSAAREGAFRWLENVAVGVGAVGEAVFQRTARICASEETVIVPVDGSSLLIEDRRSQKGLGGVGTWKEGGKGIQAMSALALSVEGTPIGLCGQAMWTRGRSSLPQHQRQGKNGEGRFWNEVVGSVVDRFEADAPNTRPWFQMDRGADAWSTFDLALTRELLVTVRAAHDRELEPGTRLWSTLERAPLRAVRQLKLPKRGRALRKKRIGGKQVSYRTPPRRPRTAIVQIRAAQVVIAAQRGKGELTLNAVFVRERRRSSDDRIEWMLLTTHPIQTKADVLAIVAAYTLRWRIEDFHSTWKNGLCRVEDTRLRSRDAIFKWATILAAVATRAMRLTMLSREIPDALATTEFSMYELQAILALRRPKGVGDEIIPTLTLAQAVRWMADTAGYNGPWKGPPGVRIVGRALDEVVVIAHALEFRDKKR